MPPSQWGIAVSNFDGFARLWLDNFNLRPARANLFFKPLARIILPVPEQNGSRINFADKFEKFFAVCVRGQIEVLQLAATSEFADAGTENEWLARFRGLEPPAGSVGITITDKENRLPLVFNHPRGDVMRGG